MRKAMVLEKTVFLLVLTLVLTACASAGKHFTVDDANKVTNGMTREEVIAIMGTKPYRITNQGKTYIWSYAEADFLGRSNSRAAKFSFDENGKTYDIPEGGVFTRVNQYPTAPPPQWGYESISNPVENKDFIVSITPVSSYYPNSTEPNAFILSVANKTNKDIEIVWDKTLFITKGSTSGGFMFEGVVYKERNNQKPNDIVFGNSKFVRTILPNNFVEFNRGPPSYWYHQKIPLGENGIYITIKVEEKEIKEKVLVNIQEK